MEEEGQITPGIYLNYGPPTLSSITHGSPASGLAHQYVRLATAADTFATDPIPQAVYDIYRVKSWKLIAIYDDPLPEEDPDFDYSWSFSQVFDAGTYYDDFYKEPYPFAPPPEEEYEGPSFGTGWTTIEETINEKGMPGSGGISLMAGGIAGCRFYKHLNNDAGINRRLNAGVVIQRPVLRYDSAGSRIWALPIYGMTGLTLAPFSTAGVTQYYGDQGSAYGFASAFETYDEIPVSYEVGMTRFITALGDTAGPNADSSPPLHGGWSVNLSVEEYFE